MTKPTSNVTCMISIPHDMEPTYIDQHIREQRMRCAEEFTAQNPERKLLTDTSISKDGSLSLPGCTIIDKKTQDKIKNIKNPYNPFEIKEKLYGVNQDLRLPLDSKCHLSVIHYLESQKK